MGWYDAVKDALVVGERLRDVELNKKLADVQMECSKLAEDNSKLREEVVDLREQVKQRQVMQFKENTWFR